jgi:hypothetical protein
MIPQTHKYFCDLAVADINAFACAAQRLLCHGSIHGAFGKGGVARLAPISLSSVDVFTVSLEHLSSDPLSDEYDYHLVYIGASMYKKVWSGAQASEAPALSKVCVQRALADNARAPIPKRSLLERKSREFVACEYPVEWGVDHYIQDAHRVVLLSNFKAFVVRTDRKTANLGQLLCDHSMRVAQERVVNDLFDGQMQLLCFTKQPTRIKVQGEKRGSLLSRFTRRVTTRLSIS